MLLPPAYGVWREGNVFSLSVHRGGPPNWGGRPRGYPPNGGGRHRGYPPNWGGAPRGTPQLGGRPRGYPQLGGRPRGYPQTGGRPWGYPPQLGGGAPRVTPQNWGGAPPGYPPQQKMDKVLDKKWTKNGQNFGQKIRQTFWKLLEVGGARAVRLLRSRRRTVLLGSFDILSEISLLKYYHPTSCDMSEHSNSYQWAIKLYILGW